MKQFDLAIKKLLRDFNKTIVVYSAIFPFAKLIKEDPKKYCLGLIDILKYNTDSLFMPTFTNGFTNGVCNLDKEKSTTGALTEIFRTLKNTKRTFCPFFSFGVYGEAQNEVISLRPKEAWGAGSLYEWFYDNNITILTLGTDITHCSFTHYVEWLMRDKIKYRYNKTFSGNIILNGKSENCRTTLFVRQLNPSPQNDWTWAADNYINAGMKIVEYNGIKLSAISARKKIDTLVELVKKDNNCLISNRELFETRD
ncbi:TPA: AAC(3) family N-acetyltransferase [Candidatus Galligastranaerophilus faecipullorum]|nr:AAC(3) family N-acetyltransferase [Candidatus Galligastranaerophilus faecipullorum]